MILTIFKRLDTILPAILSVLSSLKVSPDSTAFQGGDRFAKRPASESGAVDPQFRSTLYDLYLPRI